MKPGKILLFFIMGIILLSIDACSNPFLQKNGNGGRSMGPGSGRADDPFLVRTVADLLHVGNPELDTKYAEWDLDKYYKQTADINLTSITNWTPIGTNLADLNHPFSFTGSYDGNGRKILNLKISDEDKLYQGLFSDIGATGIVKNLGLVDININIIRTSGTINGLGGVAGRSYGTIQNCYVSGSLSGYNYIGGVIGMNYGTIQNCYATGSFSGYDCVGGVLAENYNLGEFIGFVQNCYAVCEISVGTMYGGGIVGYNTATIQNCYAAGSVSVARTVAGGVTGYTGGTTRNCVALNEAVTAEGTSVADGLSVGRVTASAGGTRENNYAWEDMTLQFRNVDKNPLVEGSDNPDGEPLSAGGIRDKSFWTNSENWNTTDEGAEAWDFTDTWVWDDTGTNMPRLKNFPATPWPDYL